MVNFIEFVFFFYIFVGLYMFSLLIFIYLSKKKTLFEYPKGKPEPVSIVMPCYNEAETIGYAIGSLLKLDYPKHMIEIIVVDDRSSDNSVEVIKKYTKKYKNVKLIVNKRNSGGAAEPTNIGIKAAKYNYVAVADSDSTPEKDALLKMIGYLQSDKTVGGVTCSIMVKNPRTFMQRLQNIEYSIISWTRKLLDEVDAALDKVNSKIVADMIKELSKNAQFIIITHNDTTIKAADQVYGCSMVDGESKIMALELPKQ